MKKGVKREISRRDFLDGVALVAGGLIIKIPLKPMFFLILRAAPLGIFGNENGTSPHLTDKPIIGPKS